MSGSSSVTTASAVEDARRITTAYSRVAFLYDAWTRLTESRSLEACLELAAIRDGEAVLEVAVGTGILFRSLLRRNRTGRTVGIDLTASMLQRARRKAQGAGVPFELLLADARALSFADASFDVVVNNNMLGTLPVAAYPGILAEMRRVLRPGGRLVIVTMVRPRRWWARWIYEIGAVWLGCWRAVQIEPFVRAAGFDVLDEQVVTQLGVPSEILRAVKPAGVGSSLTAGRAGTFA